MHINRRTDVGQPATIDFESDFRISTTALVVALALSGILIVYLSNLPQEPTHRIIVLAIGSVLLTLVPLVPWLEQRRWQLTRFCVILALAASAHLMSFWFGIETSLILGPIAVALCAAVVGIRLAFVLAVLQTALMLVLPGAYGAYVSPVTSSFAVISIWVIYGVMVAVYSPVQRVGQWIKEYYWQSRQLAEQTQQHREGYERLVKDLAKANLQLTGLNAIAQSLRQTAETARTAKEKFVANVSHELRTPLNMIIGFSEMMLQAPDMYGGKIPPALLADLAVINRNAEHLTKLVDDVLDLSQIEADQMALTKEHVQFAEIIDSATLAVRPLYESKGLYMKVEMPAELPMVFCDPTRIREVLLNLLSNAGRFTERGGVRLCAQIDGDALVVSVEDTGTGIASKDMGKLFQPFQQLDMSMRRPYGGTGLGLSISKQFIELHGGTISVASEPEVGTTITFRLPVVPPAPLRGDSSRWLTPDWDFLQRINVTEAPIPVIRRRLLVLESGEVMRRLLMRYMEAVEVVAIPSIGQAVDELQRAPAMGLIVNSATIEKGLELLQSSAPLPNGVPAIMCMLPDSHDSSAGMGVSDILIKPISYDTLLGALDRLGITQGTVLVVDDEPDILQLFGRILASSNRSYRVLLARDGVEAMSIMAEIQPNVILLDLVMPNLDGFQMLSALRESPALNNIPVIIISARDPVSQPSVSNTLAIMQGGGISTRQLLACISAVTQILSASQDAAPKLREAQSA